MSRVERNPLQIPDGVDVTIDGNKKTITVKGKKGTLQWNVEDDIKITKEDKSLKFAPAVNNTQTIVKTGTIKAIIKNMILGVNEGYQRKLLLEGVGYRAQAQGNILNLSVGFSHPIKYKMPSSIITVETPSQTEIILKSPDKQLLGQVAAEIRNFQPPEPYKGKGIRYEGEVIAFKEGKKK